MSAADPAQHKAGVAGVFDRAAATYGEVVPFFSVPGRRLVELAQVGPGMTVVDLGAGRGAATFPAAEAVGPTGRVVAGDLAPAMVELLRADVERAGLRHVDVHVLDAEAPDLPSKSADRVLAAFVIFFLPDPVAALARYAEILRPGGRLAVTTFPRTDERWRFWGEMLEDLAPEHVRSGTVDEDPGPVGTPERLAESLARAGFTEVVQREEQHEVVFPGADRWWDWVWSQGQRGALERIPDGELDAFRRRAYARLDELARPDGSLPLVQPVTYTVATRP